jgi:hypothetical protein
MKEVKITESSMADALAQIEMLEGISPKNRGCLRLLTEEMFSMCRELLGTDVMDFVIRCEGKRYALCVASRTRVDTAAREQFLSMSSNGKNAANAGVKGMLGEILEALSFEGEPALGNAAWAYGISPTVGDYTCMWTLSHYMAEAPQQTLQNEWDGMEKSIIANFADDVAIGVRSGWLEMTVTKTF